MKENMTLKGVTIHGLRVGFFSGLLITLFDSFYMFTPKIFVPPLYPLLLAGFNLFLWTVFGTVSGISLWFFTRHKKNLLEKINYYQVVFFLLPFALVYGVLGRVHIQFLECSFGARLYLFDHHLSFVWVMGILLFLFFYYKNKSQEESDLVFWGLEITTIILIFQFCSNLGKLRFLLKFFSDIKNSLGLTNPNYQILIYVSGLIFILGTYCLFFNLSKLAGATFYRRKYYVTVGIISLLIGISFAAFYCMEYRKNSGKYSAGIETHSSPVSPSVPHVILIVLDTVRADRLSMYDGHPETTKNLAKFSRDALVFENCISSSSWTMPSHASLFTGLYPSEHGLQSSTKKTGNNNPSASRLSEKFITLAETFKENGYCTCAIVANNIMHPNSNLYQGFNHVDWRLNVGKLYYDYGFSPIMHLFSFLTNLYPKNVHYTRPADIINKEVFNYLEKNKHSPFFMFVNYMDAHGPYRSPTSFSSLCFAKKWPQFFRLKLHLQKAIGRIDKERLDSFLLSQYDGEIAFLDEQLGKLFLYLKKAGIYDDSLIIITSDHGELFGEHNCYNHGGPMYQGAVRVPLMIKFPFAEKTGQQEDYITLSDLYPTILSICNMPVPEGISGNEFGRGSSIVSEVNEEEIGEHWAIYDGKYKYLKFESRISELFDLKADPLEKNNLSKKFPEITREMEIKLKEWQKKHGSKFQDAIEPEKVLSEEELEALRALGYIE